MEKETKTPTSDVDAEIQALELQQQLQAITITDQVSYDFAVAARTEGKSRLKTINEFYDSIQDPAYRAYKNILDKRKLVCEPVERGLSVVNAALLKFDQEQERLRREEQARLEAEARRQAEDERIRMAEQMKAEGANAETIDEVLDAPVIVTEIAVAAPTYEKSKAVVYRDNYSGECTDIMALIKYVAKNPQFRNLLQPNATAINAQARSLKDSMTIPGIKVTNNKVVASGRG